MLYPANGGRWDKTCPTRVKLAVRVRGRVGAGTATERRQDLHLVPQHVRAQGSLEQPQWEGEGPGLFCCDLNPSSRLHCRAAAGGSRSRLQCAHTHWQLVPTHGALAGTLISLFPFLLLSVDVLL